MFQNVEQVAPLDVKDDILDPDAALRPELRVLRVIPVEVLHRTLRYDDVCLIGTHIGLSVPKLGPRAVKRQATPTNEPTNNWPEIVDFRPVL